MRAVPDVKAALPCGKVGLDCGFYSGFYCTVLLQEEALELVDRLCQKV